MKYCCAPFFVLKHTSNFEMIHTGIDDRQFVLYYFLCIVRDIIIFNARSPKFSPSLILFWSCLLLKIVHTYQTFLEQNLKAPLYRSVQLLEGVPCVKWGEGFCCFDYNNFEFASEFAGKGNSEIASCMYSSFTFCIQLWISTWSFVFS